MVFDISTAIALILFLALIPMAFIWLRGAYRIFIKKDFSNVAVKGGEPPANPEKYAPYAGLINLFAGGAAAWIVLGVPFWIATGITISPLDYKSWSAVAGVTIWMKIFADFILNRQAHPFNFGKDKAEDVPEHSKE